MKLARGEGRATLRFRWDSRGIAGLACGDFRVRIPVTGRVVPRTYPVSGTFGLELVDALSEFLAEEVPRVRGVVALAADAVVCLLQEGAAASMNRFNGVSV